MIEIFIFCFLFIYFLYHFNGGGNQTILKSLNSWWSRQTSCLSLSFGDEGDRRRGRCRLPVCLHPSQTSAPCLSKAQITSLPVCANTCHSCCRKLIFDSFIPIESKFILDYILTGSLRLNQAFSRFHKHLPRCTLRVSLMNVTFAGK